MRSEIFEIRHRPGLAAAKATTSIRKWSSGQRTSRTDVATGHVLSMDTVDAVFDEESTSFAQNKSTKSESTSSQNEPKTVVQSLTSQLAILEGQCESLRRMLENNALEVG
jgi:hypothetical protein